jgi:hypothetical protein
VTFLHAFSLDSVETPKAQEVAAAARAETVRLNRNKTSRNSLPKQAHAHAHARHVRVRCCLLDKNSHSRCLEDAIGIRDAVRMPLRNPFSLLPFNTGPYVSTLKTQVHAQTQPQMQLQAPTPMMPGSGRPRLAPDNATLRHMHVQGPSGARSWLAPPVTSATSPVAPALALTPTLALADTAATQPLPLAAGAAGAEAGAASTTLKVHRPGGGLSTFNGNHLKPNASAGGVPMVMYGESITGDSSGKVRGNGRGGEVSGRSGGGGGRRGRQSGEFRSNAFQGSRYGARFLHHGFCPVRVTPLGAS